MNRERQHLLESISGELTPFRNTTGGKQVSPTRKTLSKWVNTAACPASFPADSGNAPVSLSGMSFGTSRFPGKSPHYLINRVLFLTGEEFIFSLSPLSLSRGTEPPSSVKSRKTLSKTSRFAWFSRWHARTDEQFISQISVSDEGSRFFHSENPVGVRQTLH